jgi:mannose-6-phosphate isomerase-like protein (cupin superfamily)
MASGPAEIESGDMSTSPLPREPRQLRCLPQDAATIERLADPTATVRELPCSEAHGYLDNLISKPWGCEYRVYDDVLVDVWLLRLTPGTSTSLHCHPRKHTVLLCLHGHGEVTTGDGRNSPIRQGTVLQIEAGAVHRSRALSELVLVEVETPRDKFDLLRLEDDAGRRLGTYEAADKVKRRLHPLLALDGAPRHGRLRPRCETGLHGFAVQSGIDVVCDEGLMFAVSLDTASIVRRELTVSGPHTGFAPSLEHTHLTIRINNQEDAP